MRLRTGAPLRDVAIGGSKRSGRHSDFGPAEAASKSTVYTPDVFKAKAGVVFQHVYERYGRVA